MQLLPGKQPEGLQCYSVAESVSEVRKEKKNVEGEGLLWWWNLIRLWQRIKKDISSFQPALIEWENVWFFVCMCVCVSIYTRICADTVPASEPGNRLTDAQDDRQALESWQPCFLPSPSSPSPPSSSSSSSLHTPTTPSHLSSLCLLSAISPPRLSSPLAKDDCIWIVT